MFIVMSEKSQTHNNNNNKIETVKEKIDFWIALKKQRGLEDFYCLVFYEWGFVALTPCSPVVGGVRHWPPAAPWSQW